MITSSDDETSIHFGGKFEDNFESTSDDRNAETVLISNHTEEVNRENDINASLPQKSKIPDVTSNVPEHKQFGNITLPGELLFSDTNDTLSSTNTVVEALNRDSTTDNEKTNDEPSNDNNDTKLSTHIKVDSNDNSEAEVIQETFLPSPIIAKTTMRVNISTSTTTVKPIKIITSDYTLVTGARPNIAQPISSRKKLSNKENNASGVKSANLSYVIFTLTLLQISSLLIS